MPALSDNGRGTTLKTVERSIAVLDLVASTAEPPRVRGVAAALGLNLSTAYHIVNTLLRTGYLSKEANGSLRIGPRIATLYAALVRGTDFSRQLRPFVEALAVESGDTAYLTRWDGGSVVIVAVAEGSQSLRVTGLQVGFSGSEDRRASGRAVLAYLSEADVNAVLNRLDPDTPRRNRAAGEARLRAQIDEVRRVGYATDEEDYEPGICCVAAPYFDAIGDVAGSVSISGPTVRSKMLREIGLPGVIAAAERISQLLAGTDLRSAPTSHRRAASERDLTDPHPT